MPVVRVQGLDAHNDNSPHTANVNTQIDLALLLSEHYGRNIRQGNSFKVNGVQAWLRPADLNNVRGIDVGVSAAVKFAYIPATGHSRRAWNNVFKQWKAQKNLAGAVGTQIRYDDMEFAWSATHISGRTSTIYGTGMGDGNTESLVITGTSTGGTDFSLEDYYNSAYEAPSGSRDHFSNSVFKEPKFGDTPFPAIQNVYATATNSAGAGVLGENLVGLDPEGLFSAEAHADMTILPTPIHVLCGLLNVQAYIMADDTVDQIEEDMAMDIAISVVSWKPLVYRPRRKPGRRKSKSSGGGRSGTKSTSKNARS